MGAIYSIIALDRQGREAISAYGIDASRLRGRLPVFEDVQYALTQLPWLRIKTQVLTGKNSRFSIMLESDYDEKKEWAAISWVDFHKTLHFEAGSYSVMLQFVHALTHLCGTLAFISDTGDDPVIVQSLKALRKITVYADGSTKPSTPDQAAIIVIQNRAVFTIGLWERDGFGGGTRWPINQVELIAEATQRLKHDKPHLLRSIKTRHYICWPDIIT
jgi:hypothetical protein